MGFGHHTRPAVVGNIGAHHRREYTAVGDAVNVASRVEQLCKTHDHDFLVTADTPGLAERTAR